MLVYFPQQQEKEKGKYQLYTSDRTHAVPRLPGAAVVKVRFEVVSALFVFRRNIHTLGSRVVIFGFLPLPLPLRLCCGKSTR